MRLARVLALGTLFFAFQVYAAAPTLSSNGFTQLGIVNSAQNINVGSPSANDLMVVIISCSQETNAVAATISPPAGWTTEATETSADTFYIQKLFWKIATGSEGATQSFTFQAGANCNVGAWYTKFAAGTFDSVDPVDATDIAWATTGTLDPPSQTFASGPRDGYVLAYASTRSDDTYSSGSDLGTNAHSNGSGLDTGRTMAVSYGAFTATSSKDPGSFVFSGTARPADAITAVVYGTSTTTFTSGPTYAKVDNNTLRATFTCSGASATAKGGLYFPGATPPTAAQVAAGTNARGTASTMCTGSSQTLDIDTSDSPAFPKYDPYVILDLAGTYSAVPTTTTTQLDPPTTCGESNNQACQYVTLTSVAIGGVASIATLGYDGMTAAFVAGENVTGGTSGAVGNVISDTGSVLTLWIASGTFQDNEALTGSAHGVAVVNGTASSLYAVNDVLVAPTYVSPGGASITLTIGADGNASYTSGSERETALNIKVYDYSAHAYASGDIDFVNNDLAPTCDGGVEVTLVLNTAMTAADLDTYCSNAQVDVLNSTAITSLPTGLSLNGTTNVITGTPTSAISTDVLFGVYDPYGTLGTMSVAFLVISGANSPNCVSSATALAACEALYDVAFSNLISFTEGEQCSSAVASGDVIATSPKSGTYVPYSSTIGITTSSGPCGTVKMVDCLRQTTTVCQSRLTAAFAGAFTLSSTTASCPVAYPSGSIFSQSPSAGSKVGATGTLTVNVCP